jgi:hypothetical protein
MYLRKVLVMNKGLKLICNIIQYIIYNYSKFHFLEHTAKCVIEKIPDLVEFWRILESELVYHAIHGIFDI